MASSISQVPWLSILATQATSVAFESNSDLYLVPGCKNGQERGPKEDTVLPEQARIGGNNILVGLSSARNSFLEHCARRKHLTNI